LKGKKLDIVDLLPPEVVTNTHIEAINALLDRMVETACAHTDYGPYMQAMAKTIRERLKKLGDKK